MKKYFLILFFILGLFSCSYDYEQYDYSNAVTSYDSEQLASGIEEAFRSEYRKYDIETVDYRIEAESAHENDADGKTLYDGNARGRVNIWSKSLDMTYKVRMLGRDSRGGNYMQIEGAYERTFDIDVTPFRVNAKLKRENLVYLPVFYGITHTLPVIETAHAYNYEFSTWKLYITEKDHEGNALIRFEYDRLEGMIAAQIGTENIDVEVEIFGRSSGNMSKQEIGAFVFKDIKLAEIAFTELELTTEMQYTFVLQ